MTGLFLSLLIHRNIAGHERFNKRLKLLAIKDAHVDLREEGEGHNEVMKEETKER